MNWDLVITIVVGLLAVGGIFFVVIGAIGIHRMPDVYSRIHAVSVTDTGGASLIITALCIYGIYTAEWMAVVKLLLTYFFILFTSPTASHAVAKMALMGQEVPIDKDGKPSVHKDLLDKNQRKYSERARKLKHR